MPGDRFELEVEPTWDSSSTRAYIDEVAGLLARLDESGGTSDAGAGTIRAELQASVQDMERLLALAKELGKLGTGQGRLVQQLHGQLTSAVGGAPPSVTPADTRRVKDATAAQAKAAERDAAASTQLAEAKTREAVRIGTLSALEGRVAGAKIPVRNENYKTDDNTAKQVASTVRSRLESLTKQFPDLSRVVDGVNLNTSTRTVGEFDPASQHLTLNPQLLEADARKVQGLLGQYRSLVGSGVRDTPKGSPERNELAQVVASLRQIATHSVSGSRLVASGGDLRGYVRDVLTHEIGHAAQEAGIITSTPKEREGLASRFQGLTGTRYGTSPDEVVAESLTAQQGKPTTASRALKEALARETTAAEQDAKATTELATAKTTAARSYADVKKDIKRTPAQERQLAAKKPIPPPPTYTEGGDALARQRAAIEANKPRFENGTGRGDLGGGQPPPKDPPPAPPGPDDEGPAKDIRARLRKLLAEIARLEADAKSIAPGAAGAKVEAEAARRLAAVRAEAESLRKQASERARRGEIPGSLNDEVKDATKIREINKQVLDAANTRLKSDKAKGERTARISERRVLEESAINEAKRQEKLTSEQAASEARKKTKETQKVQKQQTQLDEKAQKQADADAEAEAAAGERRRKALPEATLLADRFPQIPGSDQFQGVTPGNADALSQNVVGGNINDQEKAYLDAVASGVEAAERRAQATVKGLAFEQAITDEEHKLAGVLKAETAQRTAVESQVAARRALVLGTPQIEGATRAQTAQNNRVGQAAFLDEQARLDAENPKLGVGLEASNNVRDARRKLAVALAEETLKTEGDASAAARLSVARQQRALAEAKAANEQGLGTVQGQTQDEQAQTRREQQLSFLREQAKRPASETTGADAEVKLSEQRNRLATELQVQQGITSADIAAQVQLTTLKKRHAAEEELVLSQDAQYIKATAELNAAMKFRAQKEKEATANAIRAQISAGQSGGVGQGGSFFQRAQAALAQRQGKVAIPEDYQKLGQFVGSKALTTGGFFLSGVVLYGGLSALKQMVEESSQLEVNFKQIQAEFNSFGDGGQFGKFRDDIISIAQETGVSTNEVAKVGLQFKGAFGDTERAARETESAIKLAAVAGLDLREITDQVTATAIAYGVSIDQIGDKSLALQERTGVLAKETIGFIAAIAEVGKQSGLSLDQLGAIGAISQQTSGRQGTALAENFGRVLPTLQEKAPELIELYSEAPSLRKGGKKDELIELLGQGKTGAVFQNLIRDFRGLSKAEQSFVLDSIIGRREAQSLIGVLQNYPRYLQAVAASERSAGKTSEYFAEVQNTVSTSMRRLQQAFRQIGEALLRAGLTDGLQAMLSLLRNFATVGGGVINFLGSLNNALGGIPVKLVLGLVALREMVRLLQFMGSLKPLDNIGGRLKGIPQGIGRYLDPRTTAAVAEEAAATPRRGPVSRAARRVTGLSAVEESGASAGTAIQTAAVTANEQLTLAANTFSARVIAAAEQFALIIRGAATSQGAASTLSRGGLPIPPPPTYTAGANIAAQRQAIEAGRVASSAPAVAASSGSKLASRASSLGAGAAGVIGSFGPAILLTYGVLSLQAYFDERDKVAEAAKQFQTKLEELDTKKLRELVRKYKGSGKQAQGSDSEQNAKLSPFIHGFTASGVLNEGSKALGFGEIPVLSDIEYGVNKTLGLTDDTKIEDAGRKELQERDFLRKYAPVLDTLKQKSSKDLRERYKRIFESFGFEGDDKELVAFINRALTDTDGSEASIAREAINSTKPVPVGSSLGKKLTGVAANAKTIVRDIRFSNNEKAKKRLLEFAQRQGFETLQELENAVNSRAGFSPEDIEGFGKPGGVDKVLRGVASNLTQGGLYKRVAKLAGTTKADLKHVAIAEDETIIEDAQQLVADYQNGEGSASAALEVLAKRIEADTAVINQANKHPGFLSKEDLKARVTERTALQKNYSDIASSQITGQIDFESQLAGISGGGADVNRQLAVYQRAANNPNDVNRAKRIEFFKNYIETATRKQALAIAKATSPEDLQAALNQKLDPATLKGYVGATLKQEYLRKGFSKEYGDLLQKSLGDSADPVGAIAEISTTQNVTLLAAAQKYVETKKADLLQKISGEKGKKKQRDVKVLNKFKELEELLPSLFPDISVPTELQANFDTFASSTTATRDLLLAKNNVKDPVERAAANVNSAKSIWDKAKEAFAGSNNPEDYAKLVQAETDYYTSKNEFADAVTQNTLSLYDVQAALAQQRGDPIGAAAAELNKARAAFNVDPSNANRAALIQAETGLRDTALDTSQDRLAAYAELAKTQTDDSVAKAWAEVEVAKGALNTARSKNDRAGIDRAQAQLNQALQSYFDAGADVLDALSQYNISYANAHGDSVGAAAEALKIAQRASARSPNDKRLAAAVIDAQTGLYDAQLSDIESDIDFDLEMGNISKSQAVAKLKTQLALAQQLGRGKKVIQDLQRRIKQIQDGANQDAHFDVPANVNLPTLYEARRLQAAGSIDNYDLRASGNPTGYDRTGLQPTDSGSTGGVTAFNDNRQIKLEINIAKEVDADAALEKISDAINAAPRLGTVGRIY